MEAAKEDLKELLGRDPKPEEVDDWVKEFYLPELDNDDPVLENTNDDANKEDN